MSMFITAPDSEISTRTGPSFGSSHRLVFVQYGCANGERPGDADFPSRFAPTLRTIARAFRSGRGCPAARARARRADGGDDHVLRDRLGPGACQAARRGRLSARARRAPAADAAYGWPRDVR